VGACVCVGGGDRVRAANVVRFDVVLLCVAVWVAGGQSGLSPAGVQLVASCVAVCWHHSDLLLTGYRVESCRTPAFESKDC
jgi:hypothetical protein